MVRLLEGALRVGLLGRVAETSGEAVDVLSRGGEMAGAVREVLAVTRPRGPLEIEVSVPRGPTTSASPRLGCIEGLEVRRPQGAVLGETAVDAVGTQGQGVGATSINRVMRLLWRTPESMEPILPRLLTARVEEAGATDHHTPDAVPPSDQRMALLVEEAVLGRPVRAATLVDGIRPPPLVGRDDAVTIPRQDESPDLGTVVLSVERLRGSEVLRCLLGINEAG